MLLHWLAQEGVAFPIYIRAGLSWEGAEEKALSVFLDAIEQPNLRPVTRLHVDSASLLSQEHWSVTGAGVPEAATPDSAMYIPGRNILLISLAAVWCSTHDVHRIAIGSLGANPFPDATPGFFQSMGRALSEGLGHEIQVEAPFRGMHKDQLIQMHARLPLELTLTCARPPEGDATHCGRCNKCEERRAAFRKAGVLDRTRYAAEEAQPPL